MQNLTANQESMVSGGVMMVSGPIVRFIIDYGISKSIDYVISHRDQIWQGLQQPIRKEPSSGDIPFM